MYYAHPESIVPAVFTVDCIDDVGPGRCVLFLAIVEVKGK
jgi:hypothetical protein